MSRFVKMLKADGCSVCSYGKSVHVTCVVWLMFQWSSTVNKRPYAYTLLSNPVFVSVSKLELQATQRTCQLWYLSLYLVRKPNLISTQKKKVSFSKARSFLNVIISGPVLPFNEATRRLCSLIKQRLGERWQQHTCSHALQTWEAYLDEK